jgi:hypothetical protein
MMRVWLSTEAVRFPVIFTARRIFHDFDKISRTFCSNRADARIFGPGAAWKRHESEMETACGGPDENQESRACIFFNSKSDK